MPSSDLINNSDGQYGESEISSNRKTGNTSSYPENHPTEPGACYFEHISQTCRDVIQILLRENDMEDQIPHYAIYVADSGGRERALEMGERPKEMLDRLKAAGTCTELIIRKRMPDEDTPPPGPPSQDQDFGYQGGPDGMGGPRRDYGPMPDLLCQMILSTMKRPATARH
jgi:hypothetical protein